MQEHASASTAAAPDYPVLAAANTPARVNTAPEADGSCWIQLPGGDMVHVPAGHMLQPIGAAGQPNVKTESK
eukprot:3326679-Heterocapsa_arctica.AAC.1